MIDLDAVWPVADGTLLIPTGVPLSEYIVETPDLPLNTWCPDCQGPSVDDKASLMYCADHMPQIPMLHVGWSEAAGGEGNTAICNWLHRGIIQKEIPRVRETEG